MFVIIFFFFKQKTAYEMRISDWSSDVCSSDLVLGGAMGLVGLAGLPLRAAAEVAKPESPLALNIIDAAGNLALTQPAFENYEAANPDLVSRIAFTKAPSPELPGKIRAQQAADRVDIDMVIIGPRSEEHTSE